MIKSPLNYTGGKYKLLPKLLPLFPKEFKNFYDIFAGGAVVAVNVASQDKPAAMNNSKYIINDIDENVIELYKYFKNNSLKEIFSTVNELIDIYNLSNTAEYGYNYYNADSNKGIGAYNRDGFNKLKNDFNNSSFNNDKYCAMFYVLIIYAFNNQIRFNKKGDFNLPVGKRDFNKNMQKKLIDFHNNINTNDFVFSNNDFRNFYNIANGDFVYADPPYRITTASYTENNTWGLEDDLDLFKFLDGLHMKNVKFAMSNVTQHKGAINKELLDWVNQGGYNLINLNYHYNNSNYQSRAKNNSTTEVLITNYS
ncbi:Dam family site-specific DNA-(adenine-N6)-methyltransferase [Staphylococcus arlettae]|uniref:Dam family site-specific DNA-(adenine-N6)-methyltransferase n=1 Tax=Staphylococcus arlettae TaxID=29378 RepID=UPI0021CEA4BD|nr:Dam family site-specific DNA-(adenine-N6)-methyltransferase [Staphylococcus arlettae]UXU52550.1 Dam family site-specific DNA-(adenine-N6)-methyltransferase [Staphylococcus arlettae]